MADIACIAAELNRADHNYISWPVTGLSGSASAAVQLEGTGSWHPLDLDTIPGKAIGYFAGPDDTSPGIAVVVPKTSWCKVRVTDGDVQVTRDGGFIRLLP